MLLHVKHCAVRAATIKTKRPTSSKGGLLTGCGRVGRSQITGLMHFTDGMLWEGGAKADKILLKTTNRSRIDAFISPAPQIKPLNIMSVGGTWRLIDLDVAREVCRAKWVQRQAMGGLPQ